MTVPGAAPPLEPLKGGPRQIGPFTATALIGTGRRTIAYLGHRGRTAEPLVLRELHKGLDQEVFEAEVRAARSFDPSSTVEVAWHAGGIVAHDRVAIGESVATILEHAISAGHPVDLDIALAIAMGVAQQLARSGEKRIHGDLVPHHVIVGYDGCVELIDPPGAAFRERAKSPSRAGYRAPELVRGDAIGPYTDVFALGVLLFEMTTASRLFAFPTLRETDAAILEGRLPRPRELVEGYPIELQLVLRKLLRPAAAGRFQDGAAAKDALRLVAASRSDVSPIQIGNWLTRTFPNRQSTWQKLVGDRAKTILTAIGRSDTIPRGQIPIDPTEPAVPILRAASEEATFANILAPKPPAATPAARPPAAPKTDDLGIDAHKPRRIVVFEQIPRREATERSPTPSRRATLLGVPIHGTVPESPTLVTRVKPPAPEEQAAEASPPPPPRKTPNPPGLKSIRPAEALNAETPTPLMEVEDAAEAPQGRDGTPAPIDVLQAMAQLDDPASAATPTPELEVAAAHRAETPVEPTTPPLALEEFEEIDDEPDWADSFVEGPITQDFREDKLDLGEDKPDVAEEKQDPPEDKPIADVASDLLLPEPPSRARPAQVKPPHDLTSDLAEPNLQPRSKVPDDEVNDTIDEGWSLDELPSALVAHVLKESDSNLPSDDELVVPRPDLPDEAPEEISDDMVRELSGESEVMPAAALELDASELTPRLGAGAPLIAPPPARHAARSTPGIPHSNTVPSAAKPTLVLGGREAPRARAGELWAPAPALAPPSPKQSNVVTQIVRDRVVPVSPIGGAPVAEEDWSEADSRRGPNVPQARVPTLVIRERVLKAHLDPSSSDPTPHDFLPQESFRERDESEPTALEDSMHLVIPIPDDELDRAARRRKALSIAGIVIAIFLVVLLVAYMLVMHLTGEEITLSPNVIVEPMEEGQATPAGGGIAKERRAALPEEKAAQPALAKTGTGAEAEPIAGDRLETETGATERERAGEPEDGAPVETAAASATPAPSGASRVRISVRPKNARITVDGRPISNEADVEIGERPLDVVIALPGYEVERRTIRPGDSKLIVLMKRRHAR